MAQDKLDICRQEFLQKPLQEKFEEFNTNALFKYVCFIEDLEIYIPCTFNGDGYSVQSNLHMNRISLSTSITSKYYENVKHFQLHGEGHHYVINKGWSIQKLANEKIQKYYESLLPAFNEAKSKIKFTK